MTREEAERRALVIANNTPRGELMIQIASALLSAVEAEREACASIANAAYREANPPQGRMIAETIVRRIRERT